MSSHKQLAYIRNFIFGAEDSLVSTVGLLVGISVGGLMQHDIVMTGVTLIFVEAFSMGVGSYLSEYTTDESYMQESTAFKESLSSSIIMFVSYLVVGLVPLLPFVFISNGWVASATSITGTLLALFVLGVVSSKLLKLNTFRSSIRMVALGGIAISIGLIVGKISNHY